MPAAARQGDAGVPHCSPYNIAAGSPTVFIDGRPAARKGDPVSMHLKPGPGIPPCSPHAPAIAGGSRSVFVNGKPLVRVGDAVSGCTSIGQGSGTVISS
jgi:uncharacterized Zn-binding protein involved in type VI secretion